MKYLPIIIALLGCGCLETAITGYEVDYHEARRASLVAWEYHIGPLQYKCLERLDEYTIKEVDDIPKCGSKDPPSYDSFGGCVTHSNKTIRMLDRCDEYQMTRTALHEYIHVMSKCEHGSGDPDHESKVLWERNGGADTVEAYGYTRINYE